MYYVEDRCTHKKNLLRYNNYNIFRNFQEIINVYQEYRESFDAIRNFDDISICQMVDALNRYRRIAIPIFDKLPNAGQKALGYTIMEEFFYLFFQKYVYVQGFTNSNLYLGKENSYVSLSFTPKSFENILTDVNPYIHSKDQDFVLGISVDISVTSGKRISTQSTILPVVAIECKTYLEKNMLDSCANTATRLKNAMPYCLYIVASEYMKMDVASPELTDIDEVYILCKAKNSERLHRSQNDLPPLDIDGSLIVDLFSRVRYHLNSVWWSPDDAISNGKIIRRP